MPSSRSPWSKRSLTAQAMGHVDPITKAVVPPIHVATTYIRDEDNAYSSGFVYGRPTMPRSARRKKCWPCWRRPRPAPSLFSSGMAAATAVSGPRTTSASVPLRSWLMTEAVRWGLKVDFVETDNLDALREAIKPGQTKLVWIETLQPLWTITDIAGAAEIAHAAGARLAVDSTTASPIHPPAQPRCRHRHACGDQGAERPFRRGGGRWPARRRTFWTRVANIRKMQGAILGPFEAYLLMRGMRTLHVRTAAQARSALIWRSASPPTPRWPACSIPACRSIPATTSPPGRWRTASACCRSRSPRARPPRSARRRGSACGRATSLGGVEPDRTPRLHRGSGHALPAGPPAPLHRHRGCRGPVSRSRRGAAGLTPWRHARACCGHPRL